MANTIANYFRVLLATKKVDFSSDVFKIILMDGTFTFSSTTHKKYSDVVAKELPTLHGYTLTGYTLTGIAVTEDDANNVCNVTWTNPAWTAAGGDIGPANGAIIYDDTLTDKNVVGYIDFGGMYTQVSGGVLILANVAYVL